MDTPIPSGCRFCDALARVRDDPTVARLLDRLADEATVVAMRRTGVEVPEHRVRDPARVRMLRALAHGPLLMHELIDEAYPIPAADAEDASLRRSRIRTTLYRMVLEEVLVRLGRGKYALPGALAGEEPTATIDDCRRILADPRVNPAGLTSREIAERLDIRHPTVRKWLELLRDRGAPLRVVPESNTHGGVRYRYRLDPDREAVA